MSNLILSDIIGQYGKFFKATDKFFNIVAAYSKRINEETKKISNNWINDMYKHHEIIENPDKD